MSAAGVIRTIFHSLFWDACALELLAFEVGARELQIHANDAAATATGLAVCLSLASCLPGLIACNSYMAQSPILCDFDVD